MAILSKSLLYTIIPFTEQIRNIERLASGSAHSYKQSLIIALELMKAVNPDFLSEMKKEFIML